MNVDETHKFILDHFKAHAIKGSLKPGRIYEVLLAEPTHLKIRTRDKNGRSIQALFADLKTCKSLKYGEFRRVDLIWGMQHKNIKPDVTSTRSGGAVVDDISFGASIPGPTFLFNGELMPVDAFINRHSRKEKVS